MYKAKPRKRWTYNSSTTIQEAFTKSSKQRWFNHIHDWLQAFGYAGVIPAAMPWLAGISGVAVGVLMPVAWVVFAIAALIGFVYFKKQSALKVDREINALKRTFLFNSFHWRELEIEFKARNIYGDATYKVDIERLKADAFLDNATTVYGRLKFKDAMKEKYKMRARELIAPPDSQGPQSPMDPFFRSFSRLPGHIQKMFMEGQPRELLLKACKQAKLENHAFNDPITWPVVEDWLEKINTAEQLPDGQWDSSYPIQEAWYWIIIKSALALFMVWTAVTAITALVTGATFSVTLLLGAGWLPLLALGVAACLVAGANIYNRYLDDRLTYERTLLTRCFEGATSRLIHARKAITTRFIQLQTNLDVAYSKPRSKQCPEHKTNFDAPQGPQVPPQHTNTSLRQCFEATKTQTLLNRVTNLVKGCTYSGMLVALGVPFFSGLTSVVAALPPVVPILVLAAVIVGVGYAISGFLNKQSEVVVDKELAMLRRTLAYNLYSYAQTEVYIQAWHSHYPVVGAASPKRETSRTIFDLGIPAQRYMTKVQTFLTQATPLQDKKSEPEKNSPDLAAFFCELEKTPLLKRFLSGATREEMEAERENTKIANISLEHWEQYEKQMTDLIKDLISEGKWRKEYSTKEHWTWRTLKKMVWSAIAVTTVWGLPAAIYPVFAHGALLTVSVLTSMTLAWPLVLMVMVAILLVVGHVWNSSNNERMTDERNALYGRLLDANTRLEQDYEEMRSIVTQQEPAVQNAASSENSAMHRPPASDLGFGFTFPAPNIVRSPAQAIAWNEARSLDYN